MRGRSGYVVVSDLTKGEGTFRLSGAVARRVVSGLRYVVISIALTDFLGVSTTSGVGGTGMDGCISATRGTILFAGSGEVNTGFALSEGLQADIIVVVRVESTTRSEDRSQCDWR